MMTWNKIGKIKTKTLLASTTDWSLLSFEKKSLLWTRLEVPGFVEKYLTAKTTTTTTKKNNHKKP